MKKLRVLLISHTCQSTTEGRRKPELISQFDDIEIKVLVPDRWKHYGKWRRADVTSGSSIFQVERARWPWMGPAQFYLHWYPQLKRILGTFQPDIIDLWEEPWGLVSAHAVKLRNSLFPSVKVISETEQNLNRHLPFPFEFFRRYTLRHADFLIGRSLEAIEVARSKGFQGPACTVPNAVDTTLFSPLIAWSVGDNLAGMKTCSSPVTLGDWSSAKGWQTWLLPSSRRRQKLPLPLLEMARWKGGCGNKRPGLT